MTAGTYATRRGPRGKGRPVCREGLSAGSPVSSEDLCADDSRRKRGRVAISLPHN